MGTRLRSVVSEVPKCMAPVAGQPFLWYLLEQLRLYDVERVILSVGYLREVIQDWVAEHAAEYPFEFRFAVEEQPLGTGGGIKLASSMADGPELVVLNGDTFFDVDLDLLLAARRGSGLPVALALKPMRDFDRYGTVLPGADGVIRAFREKQHCSEGLINGGVYAIDLRSGVFDGVPVKFSFEKEVLEPGAAIGEVGGVVSDAYFIDIGIPEDYERAQWALPSWKAVKRVSRALMETSAQTLFLDRDGVLNRHLPGDYVRTPEMWEWMPGVLEEFPRWAGRFPRIVLVSNQRGVGKGVMSDADLSRIHGMMMADVLAAGGRIDLALYCTALDKDDPRRKPNTGMFHEAQQLFPDIDAKSSVMVGDSPSDAAFAENCGMQFILLSPEAVS